MEALFCIGFQEGLDKGYDGVIYIMKKQITLRIDEDILEWFKSQGKGYQGKMNEALRGHMDYEGGKSALNYVDLSEALGERDAGSMISHPIATNIPKSVTTATPPDNFFRPMLKPDKKKKKGRK